MRGKVLHFDEQSGKGIIVSQSGERFSFTNEDVKSKMSIYKGMEADFIAENANAKEIYLSEALYNVSDEDVPYYEEQSSGFRELFSAKGCYTRTQYWKITLATVIIWALFFILIIFTGNGDQYSVDMTAMTLFIPIFIFLLLPLFYINIVTSIKRFHDINKSGWFYLFSFIPYVGGLILLVMNGFMPSVKEGNIYCRRKKADN
ncbi:DUF805 domain-containing protein [bacterium]|nr:DUF805 domain-containing protein [bacterium]MBU1883969.1 DUF805 domain-containing protein [bacterium]